MSVRKIQFTQLDEATGLFSPVYDTGASVHPWTLSEYKVTHPQVQTSYVTVPGRADGPIDVSTVLTDGIPVYGQRRMEAVIECSDVERDQRNARVSEIIRYLDGYVMDIFGPDDISGTTRKFLHGRVTVEPLYSDLSHTAVKLTAVCEPWMYTYSRIQLSSSTGLLNARVSGRRAVEPTITMADSGRLKVGDEYWITSAGVPIVPPGLILIPGKTTAIQAQIWTAAGWQDYVTTLTLIYREGWI